jgi:hypothetical protein
MADESGGAARQLRVTQALDERTRVQQTGKMALTENHEKPTGSLASNLPLQAIPSYIVRRSSRARGENKTGLTGSWRPFRK